MIFKSINNSDDNNTIIIIIIINNIIIIEMLLQLKETVEQIDAHLWVWKQASNAQRQEKRNMRRIKQNFMFLVLSLEVSVHRNEP